MTPNKPIPHTEGKPKSVEDFERERDELAEIWFDKELLGDTSVYKEGFTQGALHSSVVRMLASALESWLAFEEKCIAKDGPYVSLKIPEQMDKARQAIAHLEELRKGVG